jgi:hypothetical protein
MEKSMLTLTAAGTGRGARKAMAPAKRIAAMTFVLMANLLSLLTNKQRSNTDATAQVSEGS